MSKYKRIQTQLKDRDALLAAIDAVGVPCEVAEEGGPLSLYDWHGFRRPEKADVVIRRKDIGGASNDLGFVWDAETGAYEVIISAFDDHKGVGHGLHVLNQVRQRYALDAVTALAEQNGYMVEPVQSEGEVVRMKLVRY
jgi:hypothetical protein